MDNSSTAPFSKVLGAHLRARDEGLSYQAHTDDKLMGLMNIGYTDSNIVTLQKQPAATFVSSLNQASQIEPVLGQNDSSADSSQKKLRVLPPLLPPREPLVSFSIDKASKVKSHLPSFNTELGSSNSITPAEEKVNKKVDIFDLPQQSTQQSHYLTGRFHGKLFTRIFPRGTGTNEIRNYNYSVVSNKGIGKISENPRISTIQEIDEEYEDTCAPVNKSFLANSKQVEKKSSSEAIMAKKGAISQTTNMDNVVVKSVTDTEIYNPSKSIETPRHDKSTESVFSPYNPFRVKNVVPTKDSSEVYVRPQPKIEDCLEQQQPFKYDNESTGIHGNHGLQRPAVQSIEILNSSTPLVSKMVKETIYDDSKYANDREPVGKNAATFTNKSNFELADDLLEVVAEKSEPESNSSFLNVSENDNNSVVSEADFSPRKRHYYGKRIAQKLKKTYSLNHVIPSKRPKTGEEKEFNENTADIIEGNDNQQTAVQKSDSNYQQSIHQWKQKQSSLSRKFSNDSRLTTDSWIDEYEEEEDMEESLSNASASTTKSTRKNDDVVINSAATATGKNNKAFYQSNDILADLKNSHKNRNNFETNANEHHHHHRYKRFSFHGRKKQKEENNEEEEINVEEY